MLDQPVTYSLVPRPFRSKRGEKGSRSGQVVSRAGPYPPHYGYYPGPPRLRNSRNAEGRGRRARLVDRVWRDTMECNFYGHIALAMRADRMQRVYAVRILTAAEVAARTSSILKRSFSI